MPKRGGVCDGPRGPSPGREGSRWDLLRRTQRAVVTKKIFPALQAMTRRGHLDGPVVGVARSDWTLEQFRARARESIDPPLRDEAPSAVTSTVVSPRPTPACGLGSNR